MQPRHELVGGRLGDVCLLLALLRLCFYVFRCSYVFIVLVCSRRLGEVSDATVALTEVCRLKFLSLNRAQQTSMTADVGRLIMLFEMRL